MAVSIAVEGTSDVEAVKKILSSRSIAVNHSQIFVTRGKSKLDTKIASYNTAAARSPWFVLRDSDRDDGDCPAATRSARLPQASQNSAMCFRLAVRSLEAWLLADVEGFASMFSVARAAIPRDVEQLADPKRSLVDLCRRSRRLVVKKAMVPPIGSAGRVGPEYVTWISEYARMFWRPDVAAANAPSLSRALSAIDRLVSAGIWR